MQKCHKNQKLDYKTEYDQKCDKHYATKCYPVPRQVHNEECHTEYEEHCTKDTKIEHETIFKEECKEKVREVRFDGDGEIMLAGLIWVSCFSSIAILRTATSISISEVA